MFCLTYRLASGFRPAAPRHITRVLRISQQYPTERCQALITRRRRQTFEGNPVQCTGKMAVIHKASTFEYSRRQTGGANALRSSSGYLRRPYCATGYRLFYRPLRAGIVNPIRGNPARAVLLLVILFSRCLLLRITCGSSAGLAVPSVSGV